MIGYRLAEVHEAMAEACRLTLAHKLGEEIYFIQAGEGGPVKIGRAIDVAARCRNLQIANHLHLKVLFTAPGNSEVERAFHALLAGDRIRGEWFAWTRRVRAVIAHFERVSTATPDLPIQKMAVDLHGVFAA